MLVMGLILAQLVNFYEVENLSVPTFGREVKLLVVCHCDLVARQKKPSCMLDAI